MRNATRSDRVRSTDEKECGKEASFFCGDYDTIILGANRVFARDLLVFQGIVLRERC